VTKERKAQIVTVLVLVAAVGIAVARKGGFSNVDL
jgi:hypothetical protein